MEYVFEPGFLKGLSGMVERSLLENKERAGTMTGSYDLKGGRLVLAGIEDISDRLEVRTGLGMVVQPVEDMDRYGLPVDDLRKVDFPEPKASFGWDAFMGVWRGVQDGSFIGTVHTHVIEYDSVTPVLPAKDVEFLRKTGGVLMAGGWSPYNYGKYGDFRIARLDEGGKVLTDFAEIELELSPKALEAGFSLDKYVGPLFDPFD